MSNYTIVIRHLLLQKPKDAAQHLEIIHAEIKEEKKNGHYSRIYVDTNIKV